MIDFYRLYTAVVHKASTRLKVDFEPALMLPLGGGPIVWGMVCGDNECFLVVQRKFGRKETLPVKGFDPLKYPSCAYERREKSLSFNFPLSAEARIDFVESIYHVEENKESIFLFNQQGEALTSIITPNESINQLYIELDLNGK